ncbi:MAG: VOC family protein [Actinomycetes bacterium]
MSKIVHFEIPADDLQRAAAFYAEVLDWEVSPFGEQPYWLVRAGEPAELGADGALIGRADLHQHPILIAAVTDLDDALRRVQAAGGQVVQGKLPVPATGWSAYFVDSEGNTVGLFQTDLNAPFPT